MIPFIWYSLKSKTIYYRDEEKVSGCQRLEGGGGYDYKGYEHKGLFTVMELLCVLIVMVADCGG